MSSLWTNRAMTLAAVVYHQGDLASAHRLAQHVRDFSDSDTTPLSPTLAMSIRAIHQGCTRCACNCKHSASSSRECGADHTARSASTAAADIVPTG